MAEETPSLPGSPAPDTEDPERWGIEDVYDPETLALIDGAANVREEPVPEPPVPESSVPVPQEATRRVRSGMAGMLMAGVMVGVAEVIDPDGLQPEMVEFSPDHPDPESMPVQFVYVPGDPAASRLIIRRWLFGR